MGGIRELLTYVSGKNLLEDSRRPIIGMTEGDRKFLSRGPRPFWGLLNPSRDGDIEGVQSFNEEGREGLDRMEEGSPFGAGCDSFGD